MGGTFIRFNQSNIFKDVKLKTVLNTHNNYKKASHNEEQKNTCMLQRHIT